MLNDRLHAMTLPTLVVLGVSDIGNSSHAVELFELLGSG